MKDTSAKRRPELAKSQIIEKLPLACQDEMAAVEFIEQQRWGDTPACVHCGSVKVYKMMDAATGERSNRFLWRCHDCKKQYTVRIGTVYEESRIELRHWCYAFWRAATSKKGVAALEIMRHCQISYKSALFLMHRIRFALAPRRSGNTKFKGIVEADEVYLGGKPRPLTGNTRTGRATAKTPVFGLVERGGNIHREIVPNVTGKTLIGIMKSRVSTSARLMTDESSSYNAVCDHFDNHEKVGHIKKEYVHGDVHTNTIESSFAILKRGLIGIHHSVSKKHLHRYVAHYDFLWNVRKMNDGDRTVLAIQSAEGKRLKYRQAIYKPN